MTPETAGILAFYVALFLGFALGAGYMRGVQLLAHERSATSTKPVKQNTAGGIQREE